MEAKKDIGKAIREKLDSPDRQPNDALWGAISQSLDENDKKKKKFPFFWFYIISCTVIGVTAIAFVLSNLTGTDKNNIGIKTDGIENAISNEGSATKGSSVQEKNNPKNTSLSSNTSESSSDSTESVSNNKSTVNKNNAVVSVGTSTQKNKGSESKKLQSKNQLNSSDSENPATENTYNTNTKNRRKSVKSGKATTTGTGQTADRSNSKHSNSYAQTGNKTSTSGNTTSSTDSGNYSNNNSHNTVSQAGNKTTVANTPPATESGANDSNNSSSGKENISQSIDPKSIGTLNPLTAADSTKTVADSLKVAIADPKEEEKKENKKDSITPPVFKKFSVFAYGGPSYFSFPDRTIVTDSTTSGINAKSTTRFGAMFGYRFNHKLSVRAGVSLYMLKQSANGIKLNYIMGGSAIDPGLLPPDDFSWISYTYGINNSLLIENLGNHTDVIINIDRELSYVEIPLEFGYTLFDKRFGVDVFGGGSMLLLTKNKVTAYNEMGQMYLGEWNAAAKTSFTGTLGLGLYYKFTPSLQLNAEPVFNYYFNAYNDSKPYSFTLRIGLQYNFDF